MSQIAVLNNATATVSRISATTGAYATVASGIAGILAPLDRLNPRNGAQPFMGEDYRDEATDLFITETIATVIQAGDKIAVTPTGGTARTYRAGRPDRYSSLIPAQVIPLSDYSPGGA